MKNDKFLDVVSQSDVAFLRQAMWAWLPGAGMRRVGVSAVTGSTLMAFGLCSMLLTSCAPPPPPVSTTTTTQSALPYQIGPSDTLSDFVYGSPDLSVHGIPVRPDGRIAIPLVPSIVAAGKTPRQLGKDIATRLSKYVRDPNVTVIVDSFHGMMGTSVRVIGAGLKPVAIPFVDRLKLLDVMTQVGGLPNFAAPNDSYIIRRTDKGDIKIPVALGALINRGDLAQNILMQPGDVLVIPQTMF